MKSVAVRLTLLGLFVVSTGASEGAMMLICAATPLGLGRPS